MDINIIYNNIVEKLRASHNLDVLKELEQADLGTATGSEALIATGFYLSQLKVKNPLVYDQIKEQIKEYLIYCRQNGLIIKQQ